MASFGAQSRIRLNSCHPDLIRLFDEVVKNYDCTILCGHRGEEEQTKAFNEGRSKVQFPNSRHNSLPSMAVDVMRYPIDWEDRIRMYHFAGYVLGVANSLGINIRWGGDWDSDLDFEDNKFFDAPHFELTHE